MRNSSEWPNWILFVVWCCDASCCAPRILGWVKVGTARDREVYGDFALDNSLFLVSDGGVGRSFASCSVLILSRILEP